MVSDEAAQHYQLIYAAVRAVPAGRVTTYGRIAALTGRPRNARQVGYALKHLPRAEATTTTHFSTANVPWWRIIGSGGIVSMREAVADRDRQVEALQAEGVEVNGYKVDMRQYEWVLSQAQEEAVIDRLVSLEWAENLSVTPRYLYKYAHTQTFAHICSQALGLYEQ